LFSFFLFPFCFRSPPPPWSLRDLDSPSRKDSSLTAFSPPSAEGLSYLFVLFLKSVSHFSVPTFQLLGPPRAPPFSPKFRGLRSFFRSFFRSGSNLPCFYPLPYPPPRFCIGLRGLQECPLITLFFPGRCLLLILRLRPPHSISFFFPLPPPPGYVLQQTPPFLDRAKRPPYPSDTIVLRLRSPYFINFPSLLRAGPIAFHFFVCPFRGNL